MVAAVKEDKEMGVAMEEMGAAMEVATVTEAVAAGAGPGVRRCWMDSKFHMQCKTQNLRSCSQWDNRMNTILHTIHFHSRARNMSCLRIKHSLTDNSQSCRIGDNARALFLHAEES